MKKSYVVLFHFKIMPALPGYYKFSEQFTDWHTATFPIVLELKCCSLKSTTVGYNLLIFVESSLQVAIFQGKVVWDRSLRSQRRVLWCQFLMD